MNPNHYDDDDNDPPLPPHSHRATTLTPSPPKSPSMSWFSALFSTTKKKPKEDSTTESNIHQHNYFNNSTGSTKKNHSSSSSGTATATTPFRTGIVPPIQEPLTLSYGGSVGVKTSHSEGSSTIGMGNNNHPSGPLLGGTLTPAPIRTSHSHYANRHLENLHHNDNNSNDDNERFLSPDQYEPSTASSLSSRAPPLRDHPPTTTTLPPHNNTDDNPSHRNSIRNTTTFADDSRYYTTYSNNSHMHNQNSNKNSTSGTFSGSSSDVGNNSSNIGNQIIHPTAATGTAINPFWNASGSVAFVPTTNTTFSTGSATPNTTTANEATNRTQLTSLNRSRISVPTKMEPHKRTGRSLSYKMPQNRKLPNKQYTVLSNPQRSSTIGSRPVNRPLLSEWMKYYYSDDVNMSDHNVPPLPPHPPRHDSVTHPTFRRTMPPSFASSSSSSSSTHHYARALNRKSWIVPQPPPPPSILNNTSTTSTTTSNSSASILHHSSSKQKQSNDTIKGDRARRRKVSFTGHRTDEDYEEPDDDITTANSGSHNYNAPSTTSAVSSGRNISSNSSKTTSSSIGMHSVEEEMAYEPPAIPISDLLDPHSTVFADTLMEIMNATLSNGDNNMNHNGTTIMNHDKVDDDSSSDDSYHGIFHSNFPVVIDARNDNHINQMITAVVTEDELREDEEFKQQAIARYREQQQKILIESQNRVIDYSSEGWGNMFDQMYEGKWKCNSCRVYNEETYTKCPACETPRETSTIDTSNSNSTATNAIISPSSIAATAPSLFVFSAAPPVSTSTTAPTTAPAFQFGAPFASSTTNNNNRETNATTSTSSLSSTAFVFNTNTADGGFTFGTTKVVPGATNGDTKPYVNPSLSVPTPPALAPAPTAFVFGASSSASAGSATTIPTPNPTFVFGASSSTANSSGGTTTNSAPAPSSVASPFVFGNASTNSATEIAALPSTNGSTTTGTNAPTFSFSTGSIDINNAPSSQPIDTTGTAVKPTFEPFKFDNTTGSTTSIASTPAPFAFSSKLPSASSADANTFGTTPPVVPTFGSNVNNANTGTDSTSQTSNTESVTTANDAPRPFVFGAATNNCSSTSAPTVPTMFATSANQPFAVSQNKPPETFVFGSSNNQKAQSMPPPATLQSGQPTNGSNIPTALPPASVSALPVQPLFGNPSAPSTTATPSAVPLFGNNTAPPLFGNHVASTHAPAPTGAFVFGSSSNNNAGIVPPQSSNTIQAPNNRFGAESAPLANPFAASASNPFTPLGQPGTNATNTTFGSTNSFMGTSSSGMDAMSSDTFAQPTQFGQNAAMTFGNPAVSNAPIAPPFNGGVIGTGTVNQIPTPAFGATMPSGEQGGFNIGTGTHAAKTTVQRRVIKARRPK